MCLLLGEETGEVEWNSTGSVSLTTPSLPQCQDVISKLKENNHHWVYLRDSSSYVVQFLLPQLLKIRTITRISIYSTKVTKDNIISLQLSNNTTLKTLRITGGSINDDGVITLVQSLKYRPLRVRSGCLYRISILKPLIGRKNFEIFQSAIFYVKMPITCCVYQCHNRQGKPNTRFFSFPKDEERKGKWIAAIRRDNWQPSKYSKVCSAHFKHG